jgi:tRNA dimethylallyltransferase
VTDPGPPPPVILLLGPTACGKTELAVALHARLPVDVVSVDSALVYRGLDIGTAKPGPDVLAVCPHRLIDLCDPSTPYSAGRFREDATREIDAIHAAGRIPLLVGGTMLYHRVIQTGIAPLPPRDETLRAALDADAAARGWPALHAELADLDPAAAARIEPADGQRIQRALEVVRLTGRPLSSWHDEKPAPPPWRFLKFGLWPADRAALHRRIDRRLADMMAGGFLEEVRALHARPDLRAELPAIRAVGYRQLWAHLDGRWDLDEAIRRAATATRQLAKRQMTWMRAEEALVPVEVPAAAAMDRILATVDDWLGRPGRSLC